MKKFAILMAVIFSVLLAGRAMAAITAQECKDKVMAAAKALEADAPGTIAKIGDKAGEYVWGEGAGYVWVHDIDGKMVAHPMKPQLNGQNIMDMKDPNGVYLFANMNDLVTQKGSGWVAYSWTKPNETVPTPKVSYVTKVVVGGKTYVVGAGIYGITKDEIKKQFPTDAVYEE